MSHTWLISTILVLAGVAMTDAANAYIYYKDASCGSGGNIQGDLYYVWDSKSMRGHGRYIPNYSGSCKYFKDGVFNPEFQTGTKSYMLDGYCIKCKGLIGCTSKKYSCQDFHTIIPTTTTYKLSYNSSETNDDEDEYESDENVAYLEMVADEIYSQLQASNTKVSSATYIYSIAGVMLAAVSMMSMMILFQKYRRRLHIKGSIDPSSLNEHSSVHV